MPWQVSTASPTSNHSVMFPRNQHLGLNPVTARRLRSLSLWFTYHVARSLITPEDCCLAAVIDLSQLGAVPRKCTTAADDSCIYTEKGGQVSQHSKAQSGRTIWIQFTVFAGWSIEWLLFVFDDDQSVSSGGDTQLTCKSEPHKRVNSLFSGSWQKSIYHNYWLDFWTKLIYFASKLGLLWL